MTQPLGSQFPEFFSNRIHIVNTSVTFISFCFQAFYPIEKDVTIKSGDSMVRIAEVCFLS